MLLEKNDHKDDHRYKSAERCRYRRTFDSESRHSELTEDEGVVSYDVQDVDHNGYIHRVLRFVGASERSRERKRYGLQECETSDYLHVRQSIAHQVRSETHHMQEVSGEEVQTQAEEQSGEQIEQQ